MQGRTLRDLVADFLRQGLGMAAQKAPQTPASGAMVTVGTNGLPVIRCRPDARAAQMSVQDLLNVEQQTQSEEDLRRARLSV